MAARRRRAALRCRAWPRSRSSSTSSRIPRARRPSRLVHALEAQFPDQEFEEIRHPMVETVDDLQLALNAREGPARGRSSTRSSSRSSARRCARSAAAPGSTTATCSASRSRPSPRSSGIAAQMQPGAGAPLDTTYFRRMAAIEFAVKYDDGVGGGPARGGHRPRRRVAHLEDAALDVPRLPRLQDGERPDREGHRPAEGALRGRPGQGRRPEDRREAPRTRSGSERAARLGGNQRAYAELLEIYEELEQAEAIHRRLGCPVIEISELSIEETAARVIRLVERRRAETKTKDEAPVP